MRKNTLLLLLLLVASSLWAQHDKTSVQSLSERKPTIDVRSDVVIVYGPNMPYIVPTMNFLHYLKEKHVKRVIDAGIDDLFFEEPEFWARGGYSEAFKREWERYFLTDPIEDRAVDWEDYRRNYQATFVAQLLYPMVDHYEVMPWPERIYERLYRTSPNSEEKSRIPRFYSTQVQVMVNALKEMPKPFVMGRGYPHAPLGV